jgi:hypothetical protein
MMVQALKPNAAAISAAQRAQAGIRIMYPSKRHHRRLRLMIAPGRAWGKAWRAFITAKVHAALTPDGFG